MPASGSLAFVITHIAQKLPGYKAKFAHTGLRREIVMANDGVNGVHTEMSGAQRQESGEHFSGVSVAPAPLPDVIAYFDLFGRYIVEMIPAGTDKLHRIARECSVP